MWLYLAVTCWGLGVSGLYLIWLNVLVDLPMFQWSRAQEELLEFWENSWSAGCKRNLTSVNFIQVSNRNRFTFQKYHSAATQEMDLRRKQTTHAMLGSSLRACTRAMWEEMESGEDRFEKWGMECLAKGQTCCCSLCLLLSAGADDGTIRILWEFRDKSGSQKTILSKEVNFLQTLVMCQLHDS